MLHTKSTDRVSITLNPNFINFYIQIKTIGPGNIRNYLNGKLSSCVRALFAILQPPRQINRSTPPTCRPPKDGGDKFRRET